MDMTMCLRGQYT